MNSKNRLFALGCVCLLASAAFAQVVDVNGMKTPKSIKEYSKASTNYVSPEALDSARALSELNQFGYADAYPYISEDGLRLYYTAVDTTSGTQSIYYATRPDFHSPFGPRQLLNVVYPSNPTSAWFTNDELEMFFSGFNKIYHASRPNLTSAFSTPAQIELLGIDTSFFRSAPSLSPDQQELYLYGTTNNNAFNTYKFVKTGNAQYTLSDSIPLPTGATAALGQISKDGLAFYAGVRLGPSDRRLHKYSRASLSGSFANPVLMSSVVNAGFDFNFQPSMSANEEVFVWTRSNDDNWAMNDLWISKDNSIGITENAGAFVEDLRASPNPFSEGFKLNFNLKDEAEVFIDVYDIMGRQVFEKTANYPSGLNEEVVDLPNASHGLYFLTIQSGSSTKILRLSKTL